MTIQEISNKLMSKRIFKILLISSLYDKFIIEQDGLLNDKISNEYAHLSLASPPFISHVTTPEKALSLLDESSYDLIMISHRFGDLSIKKIGVEIKNKCPNSKIVLLTTDNTFEEAKKYIVKNEGIDFMFFWNGDVKILLAIVKLIEDEMNAEYDLLTGQVKCVLLVEDSPNFYSNYLPIIYTLIIQEAQAVSPKGVHIDIRKARTRERPKVLLCTTYEDAVERYDKYKSSILGVISDIEFPMNGEITSEAGFTLVEYLKKDNPHLPIILQSMNDFLIEKATELGVYFINKKSDNLLDMLRERLVDFGIGAFLFKLKDGTIIGTANDINELLETIKQVPDESIHYHTENNHFSNWLFIHGEYDIAWVLSSKKSSEYSSVKDIREELINSLTFKSRANRKMYDIIEFDGNNLDIESSILKIGSGSIGGKARGIIFLNNMLSVSDMILDFYPHQLLIPKTLVITTDFFEEFVSKNDLLKKCLNLKDDDRIDEEFLNSSTSIYLRYLLKKILEVVDFPLAIRSSSLSEDSFNHPMAGLFATFFLPNNHPDINVRLEQLEGAIKLVWASCYHQPAKHFMKNHNMNIETEKMAVIIQQVVGKRYADYYYPHVAGYAQSLNYFPYSYMKPEEGFAQLAFGFGHTIASGGQSLRMCPSHPTILPQFSSVRETLKNTQNEFYSLDLSQTELEGKFEEEAFLKKLGVYKADEHDSLFYLAGTYVHESDSIYDSVYHKGPKVLTFSLLLNEDHFKFANIISSLLTLGKEGMATDIELEFAFVINEYSPQLKGDFYLLQLRPMGKCKSDEVVDLSGISEDKIIIACKSTLGNGTYNGLKYIVYVDMDTFDSNQTPSIAMEISRYNEKLLDMGEKYILMGPGRWGTSSQHLGIPVNYAQISNALVICELKYREFNVDPSQGSHFFHNIVSSNIGYFSIDLEKQDKFDLEWLSSQQVLEESKYTKLLILKDELEIEVDGKKSEGIFYLK